MTRTLRIAILLAVLFNLFALVVFFDHTPTVFTLFMFLGQPLFVVAVLLLLGAVLADLKAKGIF